MKLVLFAIVTGLSAAAHAQLDTSALRGEAIVEIPVSGRSSEICVLPKHFEGGKYSKGDLENEQMLCELDIGSSAAVCPKLNSTNPGLDFFTAPEGLTATQVEDAKCKVEGAKKVAKYKLSTSCSYTPSILGYYHLSRILGDVLEVPASVVRTVDLRRHVELGSLAMKRADSGELISKTWSSLLSQLKAGKSASRADELLTKDFTQSYGALSENPRNEQKYKEMFNGGALPKDRAARFRNNTIYKAVSKRAPIGSIVGTEFNQANVQKLVQMRDVSNMVIMDTIMSQQDRFGNIHYEEKFVFRKGEIGKDGLEKIEFEKKMKDDEIAALKPFKVKVMMLKDNDCGVIKENAAKGAKLVEGLAHISPKTYKRLLKLNQSINSDETKSFFINELLMTGKDFAEVSANLREVTQTLVKACEAGKLSLDLDLEKHFGGVDASRFNCAGELAAN